MKCFVYVFYNKKVGAYEKPIVNNFCEDDFKQLVIRDVLVSDNAAKDRLKECQLYSLGFYDDAVGEFACHKPEFIIDLSSLIEGKKEGEGNA